MAVPPDVRMAIWKAFRDAEQGERTLIEYLELWVTNVVADHEKESWERGYETALKERWIDKEAHRMTETNPVRIRLYKAIEPFVSRYYSYSNKEREEDIGGIISAVIGILGDHWHKELRNHEHPIVDEILND